MNLNENEAIPSSVVEACGGYSSATSTLASLRAAIAEEEAELVALAEKREAVLLEGGGGDDGGSTLALDDEEEEEEEEAVESEKKEDVDVLEADSVDMIGPPSTTTNSNAIVIPEPHSQRHNALYTKDDLEIAESVLVRKWGRAVAEVVRICGGTATRHHHQHTSIIPTQHQQREEREFLWTVPPSSPTINAASNQLGRDDYHRLAKDQGRSMTLTQPLLSATTAVGGPTEYLNNNHTSAIAATTSTTLFGKKDSLDAAAYTIREMSQAIRTGTAAPPRLKGLLHPLSSNATNATSKELSEGGGIEGIVGVVDADADAEEEEDGDSSDGYDEDYEREWRDQTGYIYSVCRTVESAINAFSDVDDAAMSEHKEEGDEVVERVNNPSEAYINPSTLHAMDRLNKATSEFGDMITGLHKSRMANVITALSQPTDEGDGGVVPTTHHHDHNLTTTTTASTAPPTLPLLPCEEEMIWGTARIVFRHCDVAARKRWLTSSSRVASDLNFARAPDIANGCFVLGILGAMDTERLWADDLQESSSALRDRFVSREMQSFSKSAVHGSSPHRHMPPHHTAVDEGRLKDTLTFIPILSQRHRYQRLGTMLRRLGGGGCRRRVRALQRMGVVEPSWGDVGVSCYGIGGRTTVANPSATIRSHQKQRIGDVDSANNDEGASNVRGHCEETIASQCRHVPTLRVLDAMSLGEELSANPT